MQSARDNSKVDNSESTFDFLGDRNPGTVDMSSVDRNSQMAESNDSEPPRRRKSSTARTAEKPFPVIRKPVSVKQSGALRPPQPGAPVEPPPPLTDGMRTDEAPKARSSQAEMDIPDLNEFDFGEDDWPDSDQWVDRSLRERYSSAGTAQTGRVSGTRRFLYVAAILLICGGIVSAMYTVPSVQSWAQNTLAVLSSQATSALDGIKNRFAGVVDQVSGPDRDRSSPDELGQDDLGLDELGTSAFTEPDPTSLNARFRNQLANLETLINQGELDQADQVLQTMDRSVFGYGAPEFSQISDRITAIREGGDSEAQSLALAELLAEQQAEQAAAEAQRLAEQEQAAVEAQRLAEQEQAAAEAQRLAEQERAAAEAQRLAEQERAAAEAQRLAEQGRAVAEAQRLAEQERAAAEAQRRAEQEQAAAAEAQRRAEQEQAEVERQAQLEQAEADRVAQQQQAAAEQAEALQQAADRQAEQDRAAAESRRVAEQRAAAAERQIRADRLAQEQARQEQLELARQQRALAEQQPAVPGTESTTIRDIAAQQREAARQQRLLEARQREEQINQTGNNDDVNVVVREPAIDIPDNEIALAETGDNAGESRQIQSQPISDADLQQVYQQFSELKDAIENRDIDTVLQLTRRSGVRIQQVLQMFENNVAVSARLSNVSTLESTGEIQGVLQITRLERADGSVTGPPLNLGSVPLSAVREGNGWSPIRW